ncbi:MAG: siroheme synthase [Alphaproteobacteria bacterium]|nr:siroheme synthase [Alphaproteobacteria bacterium]
MLPIVLNPSTRRIALIGEGGAAFRRYEFLQASGVERLSIFIGNHDGWACVAEAAVYERWPVSEDLAGVALAFIAGLPRELSEQMVDRAHRAGALVNVEDMPGLCDFHVPAVVRRGDLLLTASTGGKAPGLASQIRVHLERLFGDDWEQRLAVISEARAQWREDQLKPSEVATLTREMVQREGWLVEPRS